MNAARTLGETIARDIRLAADVVARRKRGALRSLSDILEGDFDPVSDFRRYGRRRSTAAASQIEHADAPYGLPVRGARLSDAFGDRFHPIHQEMRHHAGIDLAAPTGTPVMATARGKVTFASSRGGYGRTVEIHHPSGHWTRYAHLSSIDVAVGEEVERGDVIGAVVSNQPFTRAAHDLAATTGVLLLHYSDLRTMVRDVGHRAEE